MYRVLFIAFALLFLTSCFVSREAIQNRPPVEYALWVRYIPETDHEAQFRQGVRPVPMDNGWTDLRMERDWSRMRNCGVKVALVECTPQQLLDEVFLGRFRQFARNARKCEAKVAISLVVSRESPCALDRANLIRFLDRMNLKGIPGYLLAKDDRPVVLVAEEFHLPGNQQDTPEGTCLLRVGDEIPPCPREEYADKLPIPGEYQWARAGQFLNVGGTDCWTVKRLRSDSLQQQFLALRRTDCRVVILSSWNDYADGSFAEPNSLDGEAMMRAIENR